MEWNRSTAGRVGLAAFWALCAFLLTFNSWSGSQFPSDDCIYALVGREMLENGRWLVPTWQGAPFLDKGPVLPWALAASMSVLGESEFALRLPGVVAAMVLLAVTFRLARRLGMDRGGAVAAVALMLASGVFYMTARRPMTDVPGMALGMSGFLLAAFPAKSGRASPRPLAAGVMLGLSLMTKLTAPVPFVMGLIVLQAFRGFRRPAALAVTLGAATLTAVPWHWYMLSEFGRGFVDTYLLFHVVERASQPVVGDAAYPVYLGWIVEHESLAAVLAAVSIPASCVMALRGDRAAVCVLVLGLGAAAPLAASSTALPHYLVACVPALGLSFGLSYRWLASAVKGRIPSARSGIVGLVAGVVLVSTFLLNNSEEALSPDHGPDTKAACAGDDGDTLASTFDLHDMCVPWYCHTPVRIYGADPGFLGALSHIPMLGGFVHEMKPEVLRELAGTGKRIMTVSRRLDALRKMADDAGIGMDTKSLGSRVLVELSARDGL